MEYLILHMLPGLTGAGAGTGVGAGAGAGARATGFSAGVSGTTYASRFRV